MDKADLDRILGLMGQFNGSDLHLKAGGQPRMRIDGELRVMSDEQVFTPDEMVSLVDQIVPAKASETFEKHHEVDFAYSAPGAGRFRTNAFLQRGLISIAFRRVKAHPGSADELGLPPVVYTLALMHRGLILVTGPTGSGKTTTLATMIDRINSTRACHIVTIEDPIEYLHPDKVADVDQREVGFDTDTFATAMRVVLRQDPDVILVGEMRDPETAEAALRAAETGHLVFSTLHTIDATETINRIIDFFPPHQHTQVRVSLAGALKGTIAQRLIRRADGTGRLPALEIMVVNGRIQECIADPELTSEIVTIIRDGEYYGMQTFDQSLAHHIQAGTVTLTEAMDASTNPHDLRVMLEQRGVIQTGQSW